MRVMIDKMRSQQIFINLISNAIKFSKPFDKIFIEICKPECIDSSLGRWEFMFKVTDQGMGINDVDRKNLFKPFFKSSSKQSRQANTNSNGIGLNVSKRMAKVLDGDLVLSDKYRDGCQFILTMVMKRVEKTEQQQSNYRVRGS